MKKEQTIKITNYQEEPALNDIEMKNAVQYLRYRLNNMLQDGDLDGKEVVLSYEVKELKAKRKARAVPKNKIIFATERKVKSSVLFDGKKRKAPKIPILGEDSDWKAKELKKTLTVKMSALPKSQQELIKKRLKKKERKKDGPLFNECVGFIVSKTAHEAIYGAKRKNNKKDREGERINENIGHIKRKRGK